MRRPMLLFAVALVVAVFAFGQTGKGPDAPEVYTVRVTEVQVDDGRVRGPARLIEAVATGAEGVEVVNIVELAATAHEEARAQFGDSVPVVTTVSGREGSRQAVQQYLDAGTIVQVRTTPLADGVMLELAYESSEVGQSDDLAPPRMQISVDTTLVLQPGMPMLVAGSRDSGRYVVVSISE